MTGYSKRGWRDHHLTSPLQSDTSGFLSPHQSGAQVRKALRVLRETQPISRCEYYPSARRKWPIGNYRANSLLSRRSDLMSYLEGAPPYRPKNDQSYAIARKQLSRQRHTLDISWRLDWCSAEAYLTMLRRSGFGFSSSCFRVASFALGHCTTANNSAPDHGRSSTDLSKTSRRTWGKFAQALEGLLSC